jgi:SUMO ligase MMS21 Smc5/6 complex component
MDSCMRYWFSKGDGHTQYEISHAKPLLPLTNTTCFQSLNKEIFDLGQFLQLSTSLTFGVFLLFGSCQFYLLDMIQKFSHQKAKLVQSKLTSILSS